MPDGTAFGDGEARHYNDATFDHLGLTVFLTHQIMVETGYSADEGRAGYDATFYPSNPDLDINRDYAPWTKY